MTIARHARMRDPAWLVLLATILAMACGACATPHVTSAGRRVTASEVPPPATCEPLGDVSGRAGGQFAGTFVDSDALVGAALNDARNEAGRRGGDYVYVGKPQLGVYFGSTRSAAFGGRAYRCTKGDRGAAVAITTSR
jgi:hypothetical protein